MGDLLSKGNLSQQQAVGQPFEQQGAESADQSSSPVVSLLR